MDTVDVLNETTILTDHQVLGMVAAVQKQVTFHFAPLWGIGAMLNFVPRGERPTPGHWLMGVFDDADQAGALGYHDVTSHGNPLGKVFAKTTMAYGGHVSVTLSHEVLEMLGDPEINLLVQDGQVPTTFWAYEVCDAVEDDSVGYSIDGVRVSDFVTPAYFETFRTRGQFDYMRHLSAPVPGLTPGGYMAFYDALGGGWDQVFERETPKAVLLPGGRRERRMRGKPLWLPSR